MSRKPKEVKDEPTDRTGAAAPGNPGDPTTATATADTDKGEGDGEGEGEDDLNDPSGGPTVEPSPLPPSYVKEADGNRSPAPLNLLLDACELFGINPEADHRPVELMAWRYRSANPVEQLPASVTLITAGGVKLVHYADPAFPMDPDTQERLRNVFNAWKKDKDGTRTALPLPTDLTLPEGAVTGLVQAEGHVYRQGYLRGGGKAEAIRRGRR